MQKYNLLSVMIKKRFKYLSERLHKDHNSFNREFITDTVKKPMQKENVTEDL